MSEDGEILWFSPRKRGLMPLDERFHIPHGLKRVLRKQPFEVRWNSAFREVIDALEKEDKNEQLTLSAVIGKE